MSIWPHWHENKPFALVLLIIGAFFILFLQAQIALTTKRADDVGKPQSFEHTIVVEGTGDMTTRPDIATVTLGVDTKADTVEAAQAKNSATVNGLLEKIKALEIDAADIQTSSYNVYENTQWNPDTQTYTSQGWVVSQMITVKVRDTEKVSAVLDTAGKNGVTNISGPNFDVDDSADMKAVARAEAIAEARAQAEAIAKALGVRIERVVGYSEYADGGQYPYYFDKAVGLGGAPTPEIEPGTTEGTLTVNITYKLAD